MLAFVMIPLVQRNLDEFKDLIWNSHRIRFQRKTLMPDGVPNHMYDFPENYGMEKCGNQQLTYIDLYISILYATILSILFQYLYRFQGNRR